eukprot:gene16187-4918_t
MISQAMEFCDEVKETISGQITNLYGKEKEVIKTMRDRRNIHSAASNERPDEKGKGKGKDKDKGKEVKEPVAAQQSYDSDLEDDPRLTWDDQQKRANRHIVRWVQSI